MSEDLIGMGRVGSVVYVTGCRRSNSVLVSELTEGDLFVTEDNLDTVLAVVEIVEQTQPPSDGEQDRLYVHHLIISGKDKGKMDVLPLPFDTVVWLVEFVQAPVF